MSAIPSKTGVPDIVNNKLTNTVDFHIASTNFNSILKSYINFLALSKYYDSLKYEPDPITAEATFWEELANSNINLQTFAKNPKATKYLSRLEINLNDGEFLKLNETGDPLIYVNAAGNLIAETTGGREVPLTKDDSEKVNNQLEEIKTSFDIGNEDLNGEFIAWWLDKYRKCHSKVKEVLQEKLNIEDTILQEVSESVGFISYQYLTPQGRYMHYADEDSDPTPFPFNSLVDDKLELDTRKNILGLSRRTEAIFKRNIQQVIYTTDRGDTAHKENLVTDHFYYKRLKENQPEINEVIAVTLGGSYKLLTWLTTNKVSNKQKIVPGVFELVVENSKEEVDLLLNKIETLKRPFNMSILS
jgi:hypothetical protein